MGHPPLRIGDIRDHGIVTEADGIAVLIFFGRECAAGAEVELQPVLVEGPGIAVIHVLDERGIAAGADEPDRVVVEDHEPNIVAGSGDPEISVGVVRSEVLAGEEAIDQYDENGEDLQDLVAVIPGRMATDEVRCRGYRSA